MIENNHGHIVTIASMGGHVGIHKMIDYCSSKFAAVGFDEALRVELEKLGKFKHYQKSINRRVIYKR